MSPTPEPYVDYDEAPPLAFPWQPGMPRDMHELFAEVVMDPPAAAYLLTALREARAYGRTLLCAEDPAGVAILREGRAKARARVDVELESYARDWAERRRR